MVYFDDTTYRVTKGNIVYADDLNNPLAALTVSFGRLAADVQNGATHYANDTGVANAYAVTLDPVPGSYVEGLEVWLKPANSNTGASTINVNTLGNKSILRYGMEPIEAGDLSANYYTLLKYSGSSFQIVSTSNKLSSAEDNAADSAAAAASSAASVAVKTVESIAILKTMTVDSPPQTVIATGYYSEGDGSGGEFYWDAGSSDTSDDGLVIESSVDATGRWKRLAGSIEKSVGWFGAVGDGVTDDTTAVQNAIDASDSLFFPSGTYLFNVNITSPIVVRGEGSQRTIFKPYDTAVAAISYGIAAPFWSYNSSIHNVGFESSGKVGVGFTFGTTDQAGFISGMEFATNCNFYQCLFSGLDKGVQFPFGNIGSSFRSCGFSGNKYGIYTINNKTGSGQTMHAGNKYLYDCHLDSNDCAIYIHDSSANGLGIVLNNTIIELNNIGVYADIPGAIFPLSFYEVWQEENGQLHAAGSTTIDDWSGSVRSDQSVTNTPIVIKGKASALFSGGRMIGGNISNDVSVVATGVSFGIDSGYGAEDFVCDATSIIHLTNVKFSGPLAYNDYFANMVPNEIVTSESMDVAVSDNSSQASFRIMQMSPRVTKINGFQGDVELLEPFTTAQTTGGGSFNLTGSVVSGGRLYDDVNEFTRAAFGVTEYTAFGAITPAAGYLVVTYDMRCTVGSVLTYTWNRGNVQVFGDNLFTAGEPWRTVGGIALVNGSQLFNTIDFRGNGENATWQVSALQAIIFDTKAGAVNYLNGRLYCEELQVDANDTISPSGTYVQSEAVATVTELHDLKDKLRIAGVLGS